MENPRDRASDILAVVVDDPKVDQSIEDEVIEAAIKLADDMCLYEDTEEEIRDLASVVTFDTSDTLTNTSVGKV